MTKPIVVWSTDGCATRYPMRVVYNPSAEEAHIEVASEKDAMGAPRWSEADVENLPSGARPALDGMAKYLANWRGVVARMLRTMAEAASKNANTYRNGVGSDRDSALVFTKWHGDLLAEAERLKPGKEHDDQTDS